MASKAEAYISLVPHDLVLLAWEKAARWLVRGCMAAQAEVQEVIASLLEGREHLWLIGKHGTLSGCFLTSIHTDSQTGERYVNLWCLGGDGVWEWVRPMEQTLVEFCRANGCTSGRFYGRRGWARLLPQCSVIGSHDGKTLLFERRVP